jgi:hypothetical protein
VRAPARPCICVWMCGCGCGCDYLVLNVDHDARLFACLIVEQNPSPITHTHTHVQCDLSRIPTPYMRANSGACSLANAPFRHTIRPLSCPVSESGVISQSVSHSIFCMAMGSPHCHIGTRSSLSIMTSLSNCHGELAPLFLSNCVW